MWRQSEAVAFHSRISVGSVESCERRRKAKASNNWRPPVDAGDRSESQLDLIVARTECGQRHVRPMGAIGTRFGASAKVRFGTPVAGSNKLRRSDSLERKNG